MTNVAKNWPGVPSDMSSPAEIEAEAKTIASYQGKERIRMAEAVRGRHSAHVWGLIRKRALEIINEAKRGT